MWKLFLQKKLTTHIEREHGGLNISLHCKYPQTESNSNMLEKSNISNRTLLVRPNFSRTTYLLLKSFSRMPNRGFYIITKSPPEQCSNSEVKINKIGEEINFLNENEKTMIVFDEVLGTSNSKYIHQFFIRGRHSSLEIYCLSQSYFDLPKRTKGNISNTIHLFNQTLKDIENIYRMVGGYDMSYDEFKEVCRKS